MAIRGHQKEKGSLAINFTLMVMLIFILCQGPLWVWFLFTQKAQHQTLLEERVEMAAHFLTDETRISIIEGDKRGLQEYVRTVVSYEDILSVNITDMDNNVLVKLSGRVEERLTPMFPLYTSWKNYYTKDVYSGENIVGTIQIVYSGQSVNEAMFTLLTVPPIGQFFVFFLIVISIYYFTHQNFGKPIAVLRLRLTKITSGDLTVEIPEMSNTELAAIADGMKFLVKRLSSTIGKINTMADSVAQTISKLNDSFDKNIDMIKRQAMSTDKIAISIKRANESHFKVNESTEHLTNFSTENVSSLLEVKSTQEEMVGSMENLFGATENSYAVISEMVETTKVMGGKVGRVLAAVENTSASVEEIIASVKEVENSARESSTLAEGVREKAAAQGIATVEKAIKGMDKITSKVKYSMDVINKLSSRSNDIQNILLVIKEVTEQTNLLSINASILAEQAGEYGKGFAVVASEMRELGDKTEVYTKTIAGIIKTIQNDIKDVSQSSSEGVKLVREGSEIVYQVGETMSSILEAAHTSAHMTKMIERATEDQVLALRHIEESIIEVNATSINMGTVMEDLQSSSIFVQERIGDAREVAMTTKRGVDEQAHGVGLISKNMEMANERIASINEVISSQQGDSNKMVVEVEDIKDTGVWILTHMDSVSLTLNKLSDEVADLKKEMGTFRVR